MRACAHSARCRRHQIPARRSALDNVGALQNNCQHRGPGRTKMCRTARVEGTGSTDVLIACWSLVGTTCGGPPESTLMGWTPVSLVAVRVLASSRAIDRQPTTAFRSPAMVVGSTARPRCLRFWRRSTRDELPRRVVADDTVDSFDPDRVLATLARHGVE